MGVLQAIGYICVAVLILSVVVGGGIFLGAIIFIIGACLAICLAVVFVALMVKEFCQGRPSRIRK